MLAAFASTLLFSISIICGHRSARFLGGTEANFWRLTLACIFLGIWSYSTGVGLHGASFPAFLLSGIVGIGIGDVGLFQTLPRLGSRLSMLIIQCLSAPFAALIEWFWMGTPLTAGQVLCGIMILIGVGIALSPGTHLKLTGDDYRWGGGFALLGAIGNASGAVLSRKAYAIAHQHNESISGHDAAFQRIVGGLAVAGLCFFAVRLYQKRMGLIDAACTGIWRWWKVAPWVFANSFAGQTLGVSCMQKAFETTPTGLVLSITATTPIVVMPLAYFFEKEKPTRRSVIGGIVAVLGVILLVRQR
jgi:drug/metabolite transporter (DMT)-like permease